jgi:indolepyruvate ferredoxin oxidoreductase beta subunit
MNAHSSQLVRPITVAILAMGGEGGGVLADWIVAAAEDTGYLAQLTSIPGVAQRTGATIYYLELFPKALCANGREPVMALMPMPGEVDVVMASELMEAGRAIQRGLVTPDRTTLITSTNRVFSMTEKVALADGRVDDSALLDACRNAAREFFAFDMAAMAEATGSVMSAVMLGALAGAKTLPFERSAFEAAIRHGGIAVAASLGAFAAGFEAAAAGQTPTTSTPGRATQAPAHLAPELAEYMVTINRTMPAPAQTIARAGVERVADYQDLAYARLYLQRLAPVVTLEQKLADKACRLLCETARQLALAMAYEDTVRVAELKVRRSRFERVRAEVGLKQGQILEIAEFMHPRTQEIADTLPATLGSWLLQTRWARALVDRFASKGRTVKTTSLRGFLLLYAVASLKPWRPRSLRYGHEQKSLQQWLDLVLRTAEQNYDLAVEVSACRGIVKGYGDTHERASARYATLIAMVPNLTDRPDGAVQLAALRKAAGADETGAALEAALKNLNATNAVPNATQEMSRAEAARLN